MTASFCAFRKKSKNGDFLYAITFVKNIIMYSRMPPGMKRSLRAFLLAFILKANGIHMSQSGDETTLSKGKRAIAIPSDGDSLLVARNFDLFFKFEDVLPENNRLDFAKGIRMFGYRVFTTPAAVLEVDSVIKAYNKHYKVQKGDIVFDCGAFHGLYGMYISRDAGEDGRIYCFEPDEKNFGMILKNLSANGIKNIVPVKKGLWGKSGQVEFAGSLEVGSHIVDDGAKSPGAISIEVTTLEDFCKEQGQNRLDFVKMDIEGAELEAIGSCLDFIKRVKAKFAIASYHTVGGKMTCLALEKYFREMGYACVTENKSHLTTYAKPRQG